MVKLWNCGNNVPQVVLDETVKQEEKATLQQNATQAQSAKSRGDAIPPEVADLVGGGGRTRTYDLRIMRPSL